MGIEIPEAYGGAGGTLLPLGAGRRGALARRPVGRRARRRPEHAGHQRAAPLGQRRHQAALPAAARRRHRRRLRPVGSGLRQRRVRADHARAWRTATASSSTAASSGSPTATKPTSSSSSPRSIRTPATAASPRSSSSAAPGFTVGKKEDKLGIRASSTCELLFDDCRVPRGNVLGEVGKGYKVAIETLNEGRIGIGAQMIGLAARRARHAIAYTKERKQFGKAIAEFQAVQHQIARAAVDVEAATADRLQRRAPARRRQAVPDRSGDLQDLLVGSRRARRVAGRQPVRRQRLREGVPGREALPRREDRPDLRRHVEPAAADDRQAAAGLMIAGV